MVKEKWQQNFLSSHLKETSKQYIEVYYRIFISALRWLDRKKMRKIKFFKNNIF